VPPIKTQARAATILPNFVGLIFQVHNGKSYQDVRITEDMVGHKLGEFSAYVWVGRGRSTDKSDNQQHTETLHVQADQEQVDGSGKSHGNGVNASLDDDTTGENTVKYLYGTALGIEDLQHVKRSRKHRYRREKIRGMKPSFASYKSVHLVCDAQRCSIDCGGFTGPDLLRLSLSRKLQRHACHRSSYARASGVIYTHCNDAAGESSWEGGI
jgi:ribosomal protein S19